MKHLSICQVIVAAQLLFSPVAAAQEWQETMIWLSNQRIEGKAITVDVMQNQYVAGVFSGKVVFDAASNIEINSPGAVKGFLLKISACRKVSWAVSFNYSNDNDGDRVMDLALDAEQNIGVVCAVGGKASIQKFSSAGVLLKQLIATTSGSSSAKAIASDGAGNFYVTGRFKGSMTLGGFTLSSGSHNDFFVAKLSPDLSVKWCVNTGRTPEVDAGTDIAADSDGNTYVTGWYNQTSFLGYYSGDIFLNKFNPNGGLVWSRVVTGGSGTNTEHHVELDPKAQFCYLTGGLKKQAQFGATACVVDANVLWNPYDMYLAKVSTSDGAWSWVRCAAARHIEVTDDGLYPTSIGLDEQDNLLTTGYFENTVFFENTPATATGGSGYDNFLAAYDPDGKSPVVELIGSDKEEEEGGGVYYRHGNLYLTTTIEDTIDLGNQTLACNGGGDLLVARRGQEMPLFPDIQGETVLCEGDSIYLSVAGQFYSYNWSPGDVAAPTLLVTEPGIYVVTTKISENCPEASDSVEVALFENTVELVHDQGQLVAVPPGESYDWYKDGKLLAFAHEQRLQPASSGVYQVAVTYANGCTAWSDTTFALGPNPELLAEGLFPNPTTGPFTLFVRFDRPQTLHLDFFNAIGQWMGSETHELIQEENISFDIHAWPSGTYLLRLDWTNNRQTRRLVLVAR